MIKGIFNGNIANADNVGAKLIRKIIDLRSAGDGAFLEDIAAEHMEADIDLCLTVRYSDPDSPKEDVALEKMPLPEIGPLNELALAGAVWIGLGNEVVGGAGRVAYRFGAGDLEWDLWLNRAYRFYGGLSQHPVYRHAKLISPGIAAGNIDLLVNTDPRQPQRDRLDQLLQLAHDFRLPLDLHLHNKNYVDFQSSIGLLQSHYAQRFEYYPRMVCTEWSFSHLEERDVSLLPDHVEAGWDAARPEFDFICHTYRNPTDLDEVFQWANLQDNEVLQATYRGLS